MTAACPATAWDSVAGSQDVPLLRRFIQENPKDPRADELRMRIAGIEFNAAKDANTRFAYNAFLDRHPESSQALEARRRLEELDFELAKAANKPGALAVFLRRNPNGRYADRARKLLAEAQCQRLAGEGDPQQLATALKRYSDLPCRSAMDQRLKQLRLEVALASGEASQLMAFVQTYGQDGASTEARRRLLDMQVAALIQAARFAQAREVIQQRSDADQAGDLLDRLARAEGAWRRATFDPQDAEPGTPDQAFLLENRRRLAPLAQASQRLRAPRTAPADPMVKAADPRQRWLAADSLAMLADEAAADALVAMLGDAFLEVRRRAEVSLAQALMRLGPVRGQIWLQTQRHKLSETAKAGRLLFRRATLTALAQEPTNAWNLLNRLLAESEQPDLLALTRAALLGVQIGMDKDAARTARTFTEQAQRFAAQRIEAWSQDSGLRQADEAWLILRQLYGLTNLWRELLAPFTAGPTGPARVQAFTSVLGPWLERSRRQLGNLERWLRNEESRWARTHPGFQPSGAPALPAELPGTRIVPGPGDLPLLALAGGATARPTLAWAACCHPLPATRLAAATWVSAAGLARSLVATPPAP